MVSGFAFGGMILLSMMLSTSVRSMAADAAVTKSLAQGQK
jgi:hypothetical protein